MELKYTVTANINGEDISQEINESLFADLVSSHGPFKALAQKIADHINNNKDAMLISQLEAKRDKKLTKAQKDLVAEVVALMQSDGSNESPEKTSTEEGTKQQETTQKSDKASEEPGQGDDTPWSDEDNETEDNSGDNPEEVLNDAVDEEYGEESDDMDSLLSELGIE